LAIIAVKQLNALTKRKPRGPGKSFEKGKSGNPRGRPKEYADLKVLARKHTKEAVERLVFWMKSSDPQASVRAANALLDRGYGKAPQSFTGEGGEGDASLKLTISKITRVVVRFIQVAGEGLRISANKLGDAMQQSRSLEKAFLKFALPS